MLAFSFRDNALDKAEEFLQQIHFMGEPASWSQRNGALVWPVWGCNLQGTILLGTKQNIYKHEGSDTGITSLLLS